MSIIQERSCQYTRVGETTWSVDEEGVLKLSVGGNDYNDSTGNGNLTGNSTGGEAGSTVSKEEYESLKATIEEMKVNQETLKNAQDTIKKEQESYKKTLEQLANKANIGGIKAGQVTLPAIAGNYSNQSVKVTFKEPMQNTNYSVVITYCRGGAYWAQTPYQVINKTVNGFTLYAENTGIGTSASFTFNYIAVPYTE